VGLKTGKDPKSPKSYLQQAIKASGKVVEVRHTSIGQAEKASRIQLAYILWIWDWLHR
jgi:predicted nucleic acid-binding protein